MVAIIHNKERRACRCPSCQASPSARSGHATGGAAQPELARREVWTGPPRIYPHVPHREYESPSARTLRGFEVLAAIAFVPRQCVSVSEVSKQQPAPAPNFGTMLSPIIIIMTALVN